MARHNQCEINTDKKQVSKNLKQKLKNVRSCDYYHLKKLIDKADSDEARTKIEQKIDASIQTRENRVSSCPEINYPENLPVSARAEEIVETIKNNQRKKAYFSVMF